LLQRNSIKKHNSTRTCAFFFTPPCFFFMNHDEGWIKLVYWLFLVCLWTQPRKFIDLPTNNTFHKSIINVHSYELPCMGTFIVSYGRPWSSTDSIPSHQFCKIVTWIESIHKAISFVMGPMSSITRSKTYMFSLATHDTQTSFLNGFFLNTKSILMIHEKL